MDKTTNDIRQMFLDFFQKKGHTLVKSSSLVLDNDPTLLFTNAGMNQFKDVFLGLDNRSYKRATTSQRCVRAGGKNSDLNIIGYTNKHHTFFEMLGNFSFGDYFKYEAIHFAWELLTSSQWFNLSKNKLLVTVYADDNETYNIWTDQIGIPHERVIRIGNDNNNSLLINTSDNFWHMGDTGPCGPCSEIFYDHGDHIYGNPPGSLKENGDRYVEIWNLVFMQFNRQNNGTLLLLPKPSVDTGMGLERIASVLQHVTSNYSIDIFKKLIITIAKIIKVTDFNNKSLQVIADHIRSCVFLISDGVRPSNEGRGYVLRRIIRRSIRHGSLLGIKCIFFYKLVEPLIEIMNDMAEELHLQKCVIEEILYSEEKRFINILKFGLIRLEKEISKLSDNTLNGELVFLLHDTYGFPLDLTVDICNEYNVKVDKIGFELAMEKQRKRARLSTNFNTVNYNNLPYNIKQTTKFLGYEKLCHDSLIVNIIYNGQLVNVIDKHEEAIIILNETPFYSESGGQVGDCGKLESSSGVFTVNNTQKYGQIIGHLGKLDYGKLTIGTLVKAKVNKIRRNCICLNHSATHLLHATLRHILGENIYQKGSLINDKYLRFDFSYDKTIQFDQLNQIEKIVNQQIKRNLLIYSEITSLDTARNKGAIALFNDKYDPMSVRILNIGDFSTELCGGTHTDYTGNIGLFHILSESSIKFGVRRIEAVTGDIALTIFQKQNKLIHDISQLMQSNNDDIIKKICKLKEYSQQLEKENKKFKNQQILQQSKMLSYKTRNVHGIKILVNQLTNIEFKILHSIINNLKNILLKSTVIVLASVVNKKINIVVYVSADINNVLKANEIVYNLSKQINGNGNGNQSYAQAFGEDITYLPAALADTEAMIIAVATKI